MSRPGLASTPSPPLIGSMHDDENPLSAICLEPLRRVVYASLALEASAVGLAIRAACASLAWEAGAAGLAIEVDLPGEVAPQPVISHLEP